MPQDKKVTFIRRNGKVIPIRKKNGTTGSLQSKSRKIGKKLEKAQKNTDKQSAKDTRRRALSGLGFGLAGGLAGAIKGKGVIGFLAGNLAGVLFTPRTKGLKRAQKKEDKLNTQQNRVLARSKKLGKTSA